MSLPSTSARHPVATIMFFAALVLLGIISFQRLVVNLFPDLNYPSMLVRTRYADAAPEEVLEFITRPIEEATSAVSGVKRVSSRSSQGLSIVTLEFFWGTNMDYASLKAREKLDEIQVLLPESAERPQLLRLDPSAQPIMEVAVSGAELGHLTTMCRDVIRRRLEQIRGVAMVEVIGGLDTEVEVKINPERLMAHNMTIDDIAMALRSNNISLTGGTVKEGQYRRTLRIDGELRSADDIREIAVSRPSVHPPIFLREIASVSEKPKDRQSITRLNGLETIGLLVTKEAGSNIVAISKSVQKILGQIQIEYPKLQFRIVSEQADFVEKSLGNVLSSAFWGGLLAFLALFLFLRAFSHPILISVSMPVSIVGTFFFMHVAGISLNMMSLGGLALGVGMLVDNSIIVLENIFRLREEGSEFVASCIKGAEEVTMPILTSTFTNCAVFLPLIYVRGIAGQIFRDLSLTVTFSLSCSILVAISLLPALASRGKGRSLPLSTSAPFPPESGKETNGNQPACSPSKLATLLMTAHSRFSALKAFIEFGYCSASGPVFAMLGRALQFISTVYRRFLEFCLEHKKATLSVVLITTLLTFFLAGWLDWQMFPPLRTTETKFKFELSPGATIYQTAEVAASIERNLMSDAAVDYVFSHVGAHESILQSEGYEAVYRAEIGIKMRKDAHIDLKSLTDRLRRLMPPQYRYTGEFESGQNLYRQLLGILSSDIQIDIRGSSWNDLLPVAQNVARGLDSLKGVQNVNLSYRGGVPQIRVSVNREVVARYGVSPDRVAAILKQQIQGTIATQIKESDRFIDVVVRPDVSWRDSWMEIVSQVIDIDGRMIPMNELVDWHRESAPEALLRDNQENVIQITASTSAMSHRQAIRQARQFIEKMQLPENVRVVIGAQETELQETMRSIAAAIFLSIILMYMIQAAEFESFRYPLLIMLTVPLGVVGGVWMLAIAGFSINVVSGIGFLILIGIVDNDAILLVAFIMDERMRGKRTREAIHEAGRKRLRPILMTALTTVVGLLPMALAGGEGAELRQPLALVLIGGISVSTVFTLVVIPVIYESLSKLR